MLRIISATPYGEERFKLDTLLGRSLSALRDQNLLMLTIEFDNDHRKGLSAVYNEAIEKSGPDEALLFIHHDVFIEDLDVVTTVEQALSTYDVIGLAGGIHRAPNQPSWYSADPTRPIQEEIQKGNLSGSVGHGTGPHDKSVSVYGPAPKEVKLLDGVFLAAKSKTLKEAGVQFDEQFWFHFYDLDFCRSCEAQGLKMGTWSIPIVHSGAGRYFSPEWLNAFCAYLKKWGE